MIPGQANQVLANMVIANQVQANKGRVKQAQTNPSTKPINSSLNTKNKTHQYFFIVHDFVTCEAVCRCPPTPAGVAETTQIDASHDAGDETQPPNCI